MNEDKINLLIVDDEEQFLDTIKKRLEKRDFNVITVNRGEKAVKVAKKIPIDIALVDLKMPGIDGEETLKVLKKEYKWMEIVILTGHGSVDSALACTKSGAYEYLQKPCKLDELLKALKDAYQKSVMNQKDIDAIEMRKILSLSLVESPLGVLRRLKKIVKDS